MRWKRKMKDSKNAKRSTKKQLRILDEEIRTLKSKKSDLQAKINELKSSLESLSKQYKWYELNDKVNEKKNLKADIKSAESELSALCDNLDKTIKRRNILVSKRNVKIILAVSCIFFVAILTVGIVAGIFSDVSLPEKSSDYTSDVDYTFLHDNGLQTDKTTKAAVTEPTTVTTEVTTKPASTTSKAHSSNTKTTNKSSSTSQTTAKHNYSSGSNSSGTVYITDTGTKYHREGCRFLKSKHAISRSDAIKNGYEPCGVCKPY